MILSYLNIYINIIIYIYISPPEQNKNKKLNPYLILLHRNNDFK